MLKTHLPVVMALALILGLSLLAGCGGTGDVPSAPGMRTADQPADVPADGDTAVLIRFRDKPGKDEEDLVRGHNGKVKENFEIVPAIAADLSADAIEKLRKNPKVEEIEPDAEVTASAETLPWGVDRIDAEVVQATGRTGAGVKVAVLDSGLDYTHPDLDGNYKGGWDFVNNDNNPMDDNGHGTHVAGTIAAEKNGAGCIGVAPAASLYALKVLNSSGTGNYSTLISALQWCVNNGVKVANMSLGSTTASTTLEAACNNAVAAGVVLVAAAGNTASTLGIGDTVEYPARFASVIAVASTDSYDVRASTSSTGPSVCLSAPGVTIYSTLRGGKYGTMSGTSMACPHVAGTAALLVASGLVGAQAIRDRLTQTASDLGAAGRDPQYGYGLVDADAALGLSAPVISPVMHVSAIAVTVTQTRTSKCAAATVTVVDANGKPVSGASVTGQWSGLATDKDTGTTGSTGQVTVQSNTSKLTTGTFTFSVTSLSKTGWTYSSASNSTSTSTVAL